MIAFDGHTGRLHLDIGDTRTPVFPRSCAKPLQTVGMLRAGWAPADDEQVALACASHSGEPQHVEVVRRILAAAGLDESALDNTPSLPLDLAATRAVLRAGGDADSLHQNCSGKHAAMLATCVANSWPVAGYRNPVHPVQQAIRATVEDLTGETVAAVAVDGCGAPLFGLSLAGLANAFVRLALADGGTVEHRVATAMRTHPFLVGGTDRDVTRLVEACSGLVAKDGAEGVYAAAHLNGTVVAVKIDDGAGRARTPVLVAALRRAGVDAPGFEELAVVPVLGHGEQVGVVRTVLSD